jgi:hypothetical protein
MEPEATRAETGLEELRKRVEGLLRDGLSQSGKEVVMVQPLDRPPRPMTEAQGMLADGNVVLAFFPEGCESIMDEAGAEGKKELDLALGTPEWRTAASIPKGIRRQYAVELYRNVLARRTGAWIRTYDLSTGEARADVVLAASMELAEQAKALIWEKADVAHTSILDTTGPGQPVPVLGVGDGRWLTQAGRMAHKEFRGRTVRVEELRLFIVRSTAYPWKMDLVDYLQRNGKATVQNKHFAEMGQAELRLRFAN